MKQAIVVSMFFAAIFFAACNSSNSSESKKDTAATTTATTDSSNNMMASVKYTCKMHPEIISDTAGHCPKCGMEMIPMTDSLMKMHNEAMTRMGKDSMMK